MTNHVEHARPRTARNRRSGSARWDASPRYRWSGWSLTRRAGPADVKASGALPGGSGDAVANDLRAAQALAGDS